MKKNILIADDDTDIVEMLSLRCHAAGYQVDSANNATTALGKAEETIPDLVILDVDMPYGNGLSVCEMMANHKDLKSIPVIILTSSSQEDTIRRCHQLCAYYVLKCPNVWPRVEPLLQDLLDSDAVTSNGEAQEACLAKDVEEDDNPTDLVDAVFAVLGVEINDSLIGEAKEQVETRSDDPWVLLIEDDDDVALALRLRLQEYGVRTVRAAAGSEGYRRAFLDAPCAILLDYELPQGNGDYVLRRLKESEATRDIPVIVLTGRHEAAIERQMRGLGASEFLTKPFDWKRLRSALQLNLDEYQGATHDECIETKMA